MCPWSGGVGQYKYVGSSPLNVLGQWKWVSVVKIMWSKLWDSNFAVYAVTKVQLTVYAMYEKDR